MQVAIKRAMDTGVSLVALVVLCPLLVLIALAVAITSPGPALYRSRRLGKNGTPFTMYKFRSMVIDAPDIRNPDGSAYNSDDDPRLTPVGRVLRKLSLDELPQLINVLKGDMSLVGPRPDQVDQLQYYTAEERRKLRVKPGITGLAQINGRNTISWKQRKQLDLEYVERQSAWLDLRILLKTVPYVLARRDIFIERSSKLVPDDHVHT